MAYRLILGAVLLLTGCAAPPAAVTDWANHPANPAAASAIVPPPSQTLAVTQPGAATAPAIQHQGHEMPGMHPGSGTGSPDEGATTQRMPAQGGQP
jgi:hypothetical protein